MAMPIEQCGPSWLVLVGSDATRLAELLRTCPRSKEEFARQMLRCPPWPASIDDARARVRTIIDYLRQAAA